MFYWLFIISIYKHCLKILLFNFVFIFQQPTVSASSIEYLPQHKQEELFQVLILVTDCIILASLSLLAALKFHSSMSLAEVNQAISL